MSGRKSSKANCWRESATRAWRRSTRKPRDEVERASTRLNRLEGDLSAARLEASRASANRSRARAELDRTRKIHQRQKILHSEGATPRLTFERAGREFASAEDDSKSRDEVARVADDRVASLVKDIDAARRVLEDKNRELEDAQARIEAGQLRAPVDGIVVGRRGQPGDAVNRDVKDLFQIGVDLGLLSVVLPARAGRRRCPPPRHAGHHPNRRTRRRVAPGHRHHRRRRQGERRVQQPHTPDQARHERQRPG